MEITSVKNPKIKLIGHLRDKRDRLKHSLFIIEGYREIEKAAHAGLKFDSLFYCRDLFLGCNEDALMDSIESERFSVAKEVFEKISYRDRPDGLIALAPLYESSLEEVLLPPNALCLVAVSIEKPGNLGTILRSSDAAAVDVVIVCDPVTDLFNPNVIRASIGAVFTNKVVTATKEETLKWLKTHNVSTVAATPHADKVYWEADFKGPSAIFVGSEQYGLPESILKITKDQVKIPMLGKSDSLNVATATTLLLFEALRQRRT